MACEAYDHIEVPAFVPEVTRVTLHGGTCPCCAKTFKAAPPDAMVPGSPFGPNLRALIVYLRFTQGIAFERLARLLSDLLGFSISEGALVNVLDATCDAFARQTSHIRARLMPGTILQSDETGLRAGKRTWWLWVFHHDDSAVFHSDPERIASPRSYGRAVARQKGGRGVPRRVPARFLGLGPLWRPDGLGENGKPSLSRSSHS
jgi:transposase